MASRKNSKRKRPRRPGAGSKTRRAPKAKQATKPKSGRKSTPRQGAKQRASAAKKATVRLLPAAKKQFGRKPAFNPRNDSANDPDWIAPIWNDDVLLGAHVSIAGGTHEAPRRAKAIGATAMQIFTKMANRWAERICADDECRSFRTALDATLVQATLAHDSYLINLASPDGTLRRRSVESFVAELQRCEALGVGFLVSHPGNFMDDRASGIARNADSIAEALSRVPGRTVLCMEITCGSGTSIGSTFEELAALIEAVPDPLRARLGVCIDTCHAYSAGYDFVNAYVYVWRRFDDVLGFNRLRVMHLNDSKTPFASKRDRHELIGEGSLGHDAFRRIMNDDRLARVPKVIETPKGTDPTATDARMLARLRDYIER
jgi:deoxyribonuclease-4